MNTLDPKILDATIAEMAFRSERIGEMRERRHTIRIFNEELDRDLNGYELKALKRVYDKVVGDE